MSFERRTFILRKLTNCAVLPGVEKVGQGLWDQQCFLNLKHLQSYARHYGRTNWYILLYTRRFLRRLWNKLILCWIEWKDCEEMEKKALQERCVDTHKNQALGEKIVVDDENHAFIYQTLYRAFRIESKTILSAQNAVVRSGDLCLVKFTYIWKAVGNDDCPRFMPRVHHLAASDITSTNKTFATARSSGNFPAVRCDLWIMCNE